MSQLEIWENRLQQRYFTSTGEVPTVPSSATTSTSVPDDTWLDTDLMIGEMAINTADSIVWFRSDTGIHPLNSSGGTGTFTGLSDTPNSYTLGKYLQASASTLVWVDAPTNTDAITNMTDWFYGPINTGQSNYSVTVDASGSGFTLTDINNTFIGLTDTPSGYSFSLDMLRPNTALTALEFYDGSTKYVDIDSIQTIYSAKTFNETVTFNNGIYVTPSFEFSGLTTNVTITEIMTDTGFTTVNDSTIPTSSAIYYWVNSLVYSGATGSYVTLGTTQTITGEKTFSAHQNFTTISAATIEVSNDVDITDDLFLSSASVQYWGDATTDGSYKLFLNADGDLEIQKRVSGAWVFKAAFN